MGLLLAHAIIGSRVSELDVPSQLSSGRTDSRFTANWGAVANADSHTFQWRLGSSGSITTVENAGMSESVSASRNTTYQWRVRAVGSGAYSDSEYSAWQSVTTLRTPLPTPGSLSDTRDLLYFVANWGSVANASSYTFQWRRGTTGTITTVENAGTSETNTGLTRNTTYQWRVKAVGSGGFSDSAYSAWQSVTTLTIGAVTNLRGSMRYTGSTIITSGSTFGQYVLLGSLSWNAASNADYYTLSWSPSGPTLAGARSPRPTSRTSNTFSGSVSGKRAFTWRMTVTPRRYLSRPQTHAMANDHAGTPVSINVSVAALR